MRIKSTNLLRLAVFFLFMAMTAIAQAATDDFDVLMQRIRKDFSRNPNIEATFKQYDAQKGPLTTSTIHATTLPTGHRSSTLSVCSSGQLPTPTARTSTWRGRPLRKHSKSSAALAERQPQLPQLVV